MACLSSPATSKWAAPRVSRPREVVGLGRGQPYHPRHVHHEINRPFPYDAQIPSNLDVIPAHAKQERSLYPYPHPYHQMGHQEGEYQRRHELHQHSHYSGRQYEDQMPPYADAQQHFLPVIRTPSSKPRLPAPAASLSESFAPMKSPMSQCIATIIGAAEVVNRSDAWIDQRRSFEQEQERRHQKPTKKNKKEPDDLESATIMEQVDEIEATLQDPNFYRTLTLTMALERPRKTEKPAKLPPSQIGEGFYWKEYPELEDVLYCEMHKYYEYSANSRQSKHQQAYNNALVESIKKVAAEYGYEFDSTIYNDKKLRDRIRCFYKTHLQNAKKRLQTLQKHIVGPEQRRALHALIQKAKSNPPTMASGISYSSDEDDEGDDVPPTRKRRRHRSISE